MQIKYFHHFVIKTMDILKRKPRVINLRRKGKKVNLITKHVTFPIQEKTELIEQKTWEGGTSPCSDCGIPEAMEMSRCKTCDIKHQELIARLDTRLDTGSKQSVEKIPPKFTIRKEVSGGVVVTVQTMEPLR